MENQICPFLSGAVIPVRQPAAISVAANPNAVELGTNMIECVREKCALAVLVENPDQPDDWQFVSCGLLKGECRGGK